MLPAVMTTQTVAAYAFATTKVLLKTRRKQDTCSVTEDMVKNAAHQLYARLWAAQNYTAISACFSLKRLPRATSEYSGQRGVRTRDKPETFVDEWCALWATGGASDVKGRRVGMARDPFEPALDTGRLISKPEDISSIWSRPRTTCNNQCSHVADDTKSAHVQDKWLNAETTTQLKQW